MVRKGCKSTLYGILICTAISIQSFLGVSQYWWLIHVYLACHFFYLKNWILRYIIHFPPWQLMNLCFLVCIIARWINLRVPFHEVFGAVKCKLKEAVQLAGLVWEGRAHCGLDDAKNTARLLAHLMHRGFRYSITDSLMCQPVECSFPMQRFLDCQSVYAQQSFRIKHPSLPFIQCHPFQVDPSKELGVFCYCGAKSSKQLVWNPGPKHGSCFFGW